MADEAGGERLLAPRRTGDDAALDQTLRPRRFAEYIGQRRARELLEIAIAAARERGEALDHVLLHGPPGLGKTSLAHVIAAELGVQIRLTSGPALERPADLAALLTNLEERDVLFIDEIHRLNRAVEEYLYPGMEDFVLDLIVGKGPSARSMRLQLPPFTLIGATTRMGSISSPLRDRFGVQHRLEFFSPEELLLVVNRSARILGVRIEPDGAREIACRSRGTPRIANRLLKRLRDYAQVRADGVITAAVAQQALEMLEVDSLGLDRVDRRLLETIADRYGGGPVGLETLAAAVGEEAETIEDVYEPYLMQIGFLQRTPRGRVCTPAGFRHIGRAPPAPPPAQAVGGRRDAAKPAPPGAAIAPSAQQRLPID